jgi:hypothetical protein
VRTSSSDRPTQVPNTRIGLIRTVVNERVYRVTIDNSTVTALWAGSTPKVRGERVRVRFDPEKRFWGIEP